MKQLPVIVGISLPILFIIVLAAAVFIPARSIRPAYDFLYTVGDPYDNVNGVYAETYAVEGGQLVTKPALAPERKDFPVHAGAAPLYRYEVATDSSHTVTAAEAAAFTLDPGPSSPDGYTVAYEYGHSGIFELFGSNGNESGYFISRNGARKKLHGVAADRYGRQDSLHLIGWIK